MTKVRTGQAPPLLTRAQFHERFQVRLYAPAFESEREAIARLEAIAWDALREGRKAPITRPAGRGFADPTYALSVQWLDTRKRLKVAQRAWGDGTCPGEVSKTWRLTEIARRVVERAGMQADVLDPRLVTSEYGRTIHPCKGCVSSAMPLCHWPCNWCPSHALNQADDRMAEIYERWVAAHAVIILAPTCWYQSPSPLKLMIDRLVSADGGSPDPTTTHRKRVAGATRWTGTRPCRKRPATWPAPSRPRAPGTSASPTSRSGGHTRSSSPRQHRRESP